MKRQSRLVIISRVDTRESGKHRPKVLIRATHANKGKVYPYNSTKRGR